MLTEIKTLLLMVLLGKAVLLTPQPVNIDSTGTFIPPSRKVSAVTAGVTLEVDVTKQVNPDTPYVAAQKVFPKGAVTAVLELENGKTVAMKSDRLAMSRSYSRLLLVGDVPVNEEIKRIFIKSENPLNGVQVYWKNYSK